MTRYSVIRSRILCGRLRRRYGEGSDKMAKEETSPVMRKMVDLGMQCLGEALATLKAAAEGQDDVQAAVRLEVSAMMLSQFTGIDYTASGIVPRDKFGKNWRELLELAAEAYGRMRAWHALGYDRVSFAPGNRGCRPARAGERDRDVRTTLWTGQWEVLDRMVSVLCRGGEIREPEARP